MTKLSASEEEVAALKRRVAELEAQKESQDFVSASEFSPYVFSPDDEVSSVELPALAPLEMPNFDLSVLHKYQSDNH